MLTPTAAPYLEGRERDTQKRRGNNLKSEEVTTRRAKRKQLEERRGNDLKSKEAATYTAKR